MNRTYIFLIFTLCFVFSSNASAQRYLSGMRGLQITAGSVNGLKPQSGFDFGIAFSRHAGQSGRWVYGIEYFEKRHRYEEMYIPQSRIIADAGYYQKFLSDTGKTFFASVGASAAAGYEIINRGDKLLPDGATINNGDAFLYGAAISLELETYLTDRLVLLINVRECFLTGSSIGKFNTPVGIGIKFILN